jgi:hypothetical protein
MRRQIDRLMKDADLFFGPNGDEVEPTPFQRAKGEWARRLARCTDDRCRAGLLDDQLNRLLFWSGRRNRGVQSLPWPTGQFERGDHGTVQLLPLIDDRLFVNVHIVQVSAARICEKSGSGRWNPHGPSRMEWTDDLGRHYFLVRRLADGRLEIPMEVDRGTCLGPESGIFRHVPPRR